MSRQHLWRACEKGASKFEKSDSVDLSEPLKSNLDKVVKKIALESEKCNYNPIIDINWCKLPMEMRNECVKRMDFKTRCGFRGVSKTEKSLVESEKYKFKHLKIVFKQEIVRGRIHWKGWKIIAKSGNEESEINIETKDRVNEKCLSAIFKYAEVKNFRFAAPYTAKLEVRLILKQLQKFAPFPFKRVSVFGNRSMDLIMQHCVNLEKVDAFMNYRELPYHEMLNLPSILKIKELKFLCVKQSDLLAFLPELVQKWIDNDAEIGKSVQSNSGTEKVVNMVAERFSDRIIEKTDKEVRIRMNNKKTQILMRSLESEKETWRNCFYSCKVIPIDLPKSEYKKGDEWIQAIMEQTLNRNRSLKNSPEVKADDREIFNCF